MNVRTSDSEVRTFVVQIMMRLLKVRCSRRIHDPTMHSSDLHFVSDARAKPVGIDRADEHQVVVDRDGRY